MKTLVKIAILLLTAAGLCSCAGNPEKAKTRYLANGKSYMKKGQYASASIAFRNALKIDPRYVEAYYQLAQADSAQQEWRGAYASLEKAIELDPNRTDARLDRGRIYFAARDFKKAEDDADFVLIHDPNNAGAYQLLGTTLISQQKSEQALAAFSKAAELRPNDATAYINMALVEVNLHRLPDAEQHFQRAVQLDPKSVQSNIDLVNLYHLEGKLPEAQQVLRIAIQANPESPQLYIDWASMLSSAGKTADADGVLDRLRNQMPKSTDAAMAIADYYALRKNADKALAEYRRGLSVSPNNLEIEKRMEELYLDSNQVDQAAQMDTQVSKQAPKDVFVRINHGRLLMAQGKAHDAVSDLQKTVTDFADSAQSHYYLGLAYWQNGGPAQANNELQEALRISPGLPIALQSLAKLSLAQGNTSAAQTYAQELEQKFPSDVNDRLILGGVYMREAQYRLAEEQFIAAKQLAPNQAAVHLDLGQLCAAEKKWSEAEKELETAVQLDPSNATILGQYADFLVARQQLPKAIALIQQFVNNNPNNASGRGMLGFLQFQTRNNDGARAEFERAIQLDPKQVQAYLGLARVYQAENQTDSAIAQYQKALELQPISAPLSTMIGNLYLDRDLETARKYFQKALDVDPNFAVALANMAWVDAQEGKDLDVALGMAQKAKSLMPGSLSITDTLAWVMYKKGNYSGAIPLLQECVQQALNSAQYHYHLGVVLVAAGQKDKGKSELRAALQVKQLKDVEAAQARRALSQAN